MDPSSQTQSSVVTPYQQSLERSGFGHSPAYPSPARSDSETMNYAPDELGLYYPANSLVTTGAHVHGGQLPPSPQPTESWGTFPHGPSPHLPQHHDCWHDVYEGVTVTRSPLMWNQAYSFPQQARLESAQSPAPTESGMIRTRSPISSPAAISLYSGTGSDGRFNPQIKLEGQAEWFSDGDHPQQAITRQTFTVSPERLVTTSGSPYASYPSHGLSLPKFETNFPNGQMENDRDVLPSENAKQPGSVGQSEGQTVPTPRPRKRSRTTPENANFTCETCGQNFQRRYNYKAHLETHNPDRPRPHGCPYKDCDKDFRRKTDLRRHETSVHTRSRKWRCRLCPKSFPRKDTLTRHEHDGCPRRFEIQGQRLPLRQRPRL